MGESLSMGTESNVKFLVTGATGFIGSRLITMLLAAGIAVVGAGEVASEVQERRRAALERAGTTVETGSITDAEYCRSIVAGCSHVIHLAAVQHEMNVPRQKFFDVNVEGTRNLLAASAAAGVQRFVYGSTIGVYGDGGGQVLDEDSPVKPLNDYGDSKLAAEKVVLEWSSRLPVAIVRISETYGPGDQRLLKLFRAMDRGRFMLVGNGLNRKQLVFVDDLAAGLLAAAEHPAAVGQIFLLAGLETLTTRDMLGHVAAALSKPAPARSLPMWPFVLAAFTMETALRPLGIQPPLHRRRLDFFRKSFVVSSRKAQSTIGYRPGTTFAAGARATADWYRTEGLL